MLGGRARVLGVFGIVTAVCLASDLTSKEFVGSWVESHGPVELVPGWLTLVFHTNPYGIVGIGWFLGERANAVLQILSTFAVVGILVWTVAALSAGREGFAAVLGMILGGALGNLFDRWRYDGVRDFIDAHYYEYYHYPTFNLADSFLVCGAGLLILGSLRHRVAEVPESSCSEQPAANTD